MVFKKFYKKVFVFLTMIALLIMVNTGFANLDNSEICIRREVFLNEKNKNTILVKLIARTNETIEFYEEIPKECTVGEHGTMIASKKNLKAIITNDSETQYELMCNYGNHTIQGYYFINGNPKEKFYIKNSTFFIDKVIPKELPIVFWFLLLFLLIVFFISVLKKEEI